MKRLLSISTLYPAPGRAGFGRFVSRQMEALAARGDWQVTVVNPIGQPPLPLKRYAALKAIPRVELQGEITVHHPRFHLVPGLSGPINPSLIAHAILPLARQLHAEQPFDIVDAQFFYPDGPAAAKVAQALGLPLAIKARGSDIHLWGEKSLARRQMLAAAQQASVLLAVSRDVRKPSNSSLALSLKFPASSACSATARNGACASNTRCSPAPTAWRRRT